MLESFVVDPDPLAGVDVGSGGVVGGRIGRFVVHLDLENKEKMIDN